MSLPGTQELLLLLLIFAVPFLTYRIAKAKGFDPMMWLIAGSFFWGIALLVVALLPRKDFPGHG